MTPDGWYNYPPKTAYYPDYYENGMYVVRSTQLTNVTSTAQTYYVQTIFSNTDVNYLTPRRGYAKDKTTPRAKATVRAFQQPLELSILPAHPALMLDTSMKVVRWNRRCLSASRPRASHRRRQRPEGWVGR